MHLIIGSKVYSSWSLRPWLLMRALDIPFQETVIPLYQPDTTARLSAYSPTSKVPCLIDRDIVVWESLAIIEYLAEQCPDRRIWPADRAARAHARAVSTEMHAGFQALRKHCPMVVTQRFAARPLPADVAADVSRVAAIWTEARGRFGAIAGGPFLYGDFCAADAMFAPVATRLRTYSIVVEPVAQTYLDAVLAHPAYQAWLTDAAAEPWVAAQHEDGMVSLENLRSQR